MDAELSLLAIALLVIVTVYPVYLVWRFLTLGIKAFKLYIRNAKHEQYSLDASDYECDSLDDDSSVC